MASSSRRRVAPGVRLVLTRGDFAGCLQKLSYEPPIVQFKHGYLWVGGDNGPCYGHYSGPQTLRKLAREILRQIKPPRKRKKP